MVNVGARSNYFLEIRVTFKQKIFSLNFDVRFVKKDEYGSSGLKFHETRTLNGWEKAGAVLCFMRIKNVIFCSLSNPPPHLFCKKKRVIDLTS